MFTGLFRLLLALAVILFARRVIRGFMAPRRKSTSRPKTPPRPTREADIGHGQPIEEADYEELD